MARQFVWIDDKFYSFSMSIICGENYYYMIASLDHVVYSGLCHGLRLVATTIVSRNMTKHAVILGKNICHHVVKKRVCNSTHLSLSWNFFVRQYFWPNILFKVWNMEYVFLPSLSYATLLVHVTIVLVFCILYHLGSFPFSLVAYYLIKKKVYVRI